MPRSVSPSAVLSELLMESSAAFPASGFQAATVPSSVANRKTAGLPSVSKKALGLLVWNGLNTCPVGAEVSPDGDGMVTGSRTFSVTLPPTNESMLDSPVPLSEIQNGLVNENETPQGLTRLGSVVRAWIAPSETRLCWMKRGVADAPKPSARCVNGTVSAWCDILASLCVIYREGRTRALDHLW